MAVISKIQLPTGTTYDLKDANALPLSGGTLTGKLTLAVNPTNNMDAVTKQYMESKGYLTLSDLPIYDGTVV